MEDSDEVVQQPVRTERRLLVEQRALHVAAIDLMMTEGSELVVAMMLREQFLIRDVVVAAIAEEPDVSLASLLQNGFKG
jgi:hypothetical protein